MHCAFALNRPVASETPSTFMVLNLDGDWLDKFRNRTARG